MIVHPLLHVMIVVPINILMMLMTHVQIVMLHVMDVKIMILQTMLNVLHVRQKCKPMKLMVLI